MSWLDGLRHRIRTTLRAGDFERELKEELRHHQELQGANGGPPLGNVTNIMEGVRDMTLLSRLDFLRQEIGYALRSIRRTPGVAATIVITLALGVGVNGAVFNVLDQLYLRNPAGVVDPGGIRRIWTRHTRTSLPVFFSRAVAYPQYKVLAEQWGDPSTLAVMTLQSEYKLGGTRTGTSTAILFTTGNYFPLLGVRPFKGRFFSYAESQPGASTRQLVLSHRYWKNALGGDESIVGRRIRLDTLDWEVIGVAPEGFNGIDIRAEDVWAPLGALPGADEPKYAGQTIWQSPRFIAFFTIGRAGAGLNAPEFERRATAALREANKGLYGRDADTVMTVSLGSIIEARGPAAAAKEEVIVTRLQGVAFIVLLIACANVVNILLARAVSRRREIAVRLALGISRARLIRLITIEAVVLAATAAMAALGTAWAGGAMLRSQLMADVKFVQPAIHPHVVWATVLVALVCGVVAGVIPAVQFSRPEVTADLKDGGRGAGRTRSRLRNGLVIAQAALSVTLLVGATLLVRTLRNIEGIDIGFDRSQSFMVWPSYDPGTAPPMDERVAKTAEVEAQLRGRNGVVAVGRTALLPMGGMSFWTFWWGSDSSRSLMKSYPFGYAVSSGYFDAAGLRLLSGRTFDDGAAGESQVVVNEAFAKLLWPSGNALGQCIRFEKRDAACTVVTGVVATASARDVIEAPQPQFYLPIGTHLTQKMGGMILMIRARGEAAAAVQRDAITLFKQAIPNGYPQVKTIAEIVEPNYRPWRLGARLFTAVGVLALIVAVIGIYSTVTYSVNQRTHEFGVRMALGAQMRDVLNQVVGEGVRVVAIGIAVGVVLAIASSRLVSSLLYGVEPTDVSAMILAAAILLSAAIAASIVPAWRAARADPVGALRGE